MGFSLSLPGFHLNIGKSHHCHGHHHHHCRRPMFPPMPRRGGCCGGGGGCGGGGCCGGGGIRSQLNQLMQMLMQLLGRGGMGNNMNVNNGVVNNYYYC